MRGASFFLPLCFVLTAFGSCTGAVDEAPTGSVTQKTKDVSGKLSLALGGVAPGWELLKIDESPNSLDFSTQDTDLIELAIPPGFSSYIEAKTAEVTPKEVGIAYVTPTVNSRERDPIQVTISPQKLIQILVGEARGQLTREATLDDDQVQTSSVSVTGDALGAVIRNRINKINEAESPGLFKADAALYTSNPPVSYYEAVIEGGDETYQFSPVDPTDPTHKFYLNAAQREDLKDDNLAAYDQAVLTAAEIFNEGTEDPTNGAFAFYSPSENEYEALQESLESGRLDLPSGAGTSDARYPSLAPVQVLILQDVASATSRDSRPSFVFVRERNETEPAVTDVP